MATRQCAQDYARLDQAAERRAGQQLNRSAVCDGPLENQKINDRRFVLNHEVNYLQELPLYAVDFSPFDGIMKAEIREISTPDNTFGEHYEGSLASGRIYQSVRLSAGLLSFIHSMSSKISSPTCVFILA